jgi:transposase
VSCAGSAPTTATSLLLCTVPGISWVLAYTIAAEIGDIGRFAAPRKLAGYSGSLPARLPIGRARPARPARQAGTRYLRWALNSAGNAAHAFYPAVRAARAEFRRRARGASSAPGTARET